MGSYAPLWFLWDDRSLCKSVSCFKSVWVVRKSTGICTSRWSPGWHQLTRHTLEPGLITTQPVCVPTRLSVGLRGLYVVWVSMYNMGGWPGSYHQLTNNWRCQLNDLTSEPSGDLHLASSWLLSRDRELFGMMSDVPLPRDNSVQHYYWYRAAMWPSSRGSHLTAPLMKLCCINHAPPTLQWMFKICC